MTTTDIPTTHEQAEPSLVMLDPKALAAHPSNVRHKLRDLRGMVRSIKAAGILVPLVVVPSDNGRHQIVAGHRRCAAAIEAGLTQVPCLVRPDLDDARQVAAMLVENTQREGLSGVEEAAGYQQLAMLGLSDSGIAKATGATRRHVEKARRVAASGVAAVVAERCDLTLDQALVIAEFDDDGAAVKELALTAAKDPGQFEHRASRLRQDRARAAQREATVRELTDAGISVLDPAQRYDMHPNAVSLRDLANGEGTPLTPEGHAACPGHCAVVSESAPTNVGYYCLDPRRHGHRSRYGSGRPKGKMTDQEKAERRQVIENNKAWKAAEPVRRRHLQGLLASRKVPPGTLRYVVGEVLAAPDRVGEGADALLAQLLGVTASTGYGRQVGSQLVGRLPDSRLPLGLLAQVAADNEHAMGTHTWRQRDIRAARWLSFLASVGYSLSDIEQQVIDQAEPASDDDEPDASADDATEPAAEVVVLHPARNGPPGDDDGTTDEARPDTTDDVS